MRPHGNRCEAGGARRQGLVCQAAELTEGADTVFLGARRAPAAVIQPAGGRRADAR
jgi:hypothetical protein